MNLKVNKYHFGGPWFCGLLGLLLLGCQTRGANRNPELRKLSDLWERGSIAADQEELHKASAGDEIFVSGDIFNVPAIQVSSPFSFTGPNGVRIEFPISTVPMIEEASRWLYYVLQEPVSYSTKEGAIREVEIGFVESKETPENIWIYWKKPKGSYFYSKRGEQLSLPEIPQLQRTETIFSNPIGRKVSLYYSGFHSGQIHFVLEDSSEQRSASRMEFHFDILADQLPMRAAIRGLVFEVSAVDSVSLEYRWIQISL
jgi:hypothetical protein